MEIILGVIVSLIAQFVKKVTNASEYKSLAIVIALALISAVVYSLLSYIGYWDAVREVLVYAGAFYTFIIARFPSASSK